MSSDLEEVAVLGLGAMGLGMAENLASACRRVHVWNRTPSTAGQLAESIDQIVVHESPQAAADAARIVISMVTNDEASRRVWLDDDGALGGLDNSTIAIESSTLSPAWIAELATHIGQSGAGFVEAPLAGSRPQLADRALVYLVGADPLTLEAVRPVLDVSAAAIRHCGPVGTGGVTKLAVNALFGAQVATYAEVLHFMQRSGLDREDSIRFMRGLPLTSPYLDRILGLFEIEDFSPNFPIDLVVKDFGYLVDAAVAVGADATIAGTVAEVFAAASTAGHGALDIAGVERLHG